MARLKAPSSFQCGISVAGPLLVSLVCSSAISFRIILTLFGALRDQAPRL